MVYTSYFAKYKGDKGVSIARFNSKWWEGKDWYPTLAPSKELIKWWKSLTEEQRASTGYIVQYTERFMQETLKPLEPFIEDIYEALDGRVLLCYENLDKSFCHREVVAAWFESHGFKCEEL